MPLLSSFDRVRFLRGRVSSGLLLPQGQEKKFDGGELGT